MDKKLLKVLALLAIMLGMFTVGFFYGNLEGRFQGMKDTAYMIGTMLEPADVEINIQFNETRFVNEIGRIVEERNG